MPRQQPQPQVVVEIGGRQSKPAEMDLGDLARVMSQFRKAVGAAAADMSVGPEFSVNLLAIEEGSSRLRLLVAGALSVFAALSRAVEASNYEEVGVEAQSLLHTLSNTLEKGDRELRFIADPAHGIAGARISPDQPVPMPPQPPSARGSTTIYGRARGIEERASGAALTIRLFDGAEVRVSVGFGLVGQAGSLVTRDIRADVMAEWGTKDWRLRGAELLSIDPFSPPSFGEAITRLQALPGVNWEQVHPSPRHPADDEEAK